MEVLSKGTEQQQDGVARTSLPEAPSVQSTQKQKTSEGNGKKKRRRGKSKRKIVKPCPKFNWQNRRRNDKSKRDQRYRAIVLSKTHAPFNNNQFLMEIHKPEPEGNFQISQTPSARARTRDSSFSVDSEENYFYSLPEDEEDFLTKEFSSVYEDAQSERLANMSKTELIQEYLLLEAKYDNLVKRNERARCKLSEDEKESSSTTDRDSMSTDKDMSSTSADNSKAESIQDVLMRVKEQEDQIRDLTMANEKLRLENEHLQKGNCSSSEDSESDSSSTTISSSSSSCVSPPHEVTSVTVVTETVHAALNGNGQNGLDHETPHVNGFSRSPNCEEHNPD